MRRIRSRWLCSADSPGIAERSRPRSMRWQTAARVSLIAFSCQFLLCCQNAAVTDVCADSSVSVGRICRQAAGSCGSPGPWSSGSLRSQCTSFPGVPFSPFPGRSIPTTRPVIMPTAAPMQASSMVPISTPRESEKQGQRVQPVLPFHGSSPRTAFVHLTISCSSMTEQPLLS